MEKNRYYFQIFANFNIESYKDFWFERPDFLLWGAWYTDDRTLANNETVRRFIMSFIKYQFNNEAFYIVQLNTNTEWVYWDFEIGYKDSYNNIKSIGSWYVNCLWTDELYNIWNLYK